MFQHVVRWTFLITIWKKYKGQLLTTLAYILGLLIISLVHSDYLDYVAVSKQGQEFVSKSFLLKWLAYIIITAVYFWLFKSFSKVEKEGHEDLSFLRKFSSKRKTKSGSVSGRSEDKVAKSVKSQGTKSANTSNDPFANIRKKEKLRSEADLIVEQADKK